MRICFDHVGRGRPSHQGRATIGHVTVDAALDHPYKGGREVEGDHPPHARDTRQTRCRQSPLPRPSPRLRLRPATSPRAARPARSPPGASRARPVRFGLSPGSVHEARGTRRPRPPAPISIPDAASATRAIADMRTKRSDRRSRVPAPPARASSSPPRAPRPPQPRTSFLSKIPDPRLLRLLQARRPQARRLSRGPGQGDDRSHHWIHRQG